MTPDEYLGVPEILRIWPKAGSTSQYQGADKRIKRGAIHLDQEEDFRALASNKDCNRLERATWVGGLKWSREL